MLSCSTVRPVSRVDGDLDGGLLHAGGGLRCVFVAAGEGEGGDGGDGDEGQSGVRALHGLFLFKVEFESDLIWVEREVELLVTWER
jgi:hypothetical protein